MDASLLGGAVDVIQALWWFRQDGAGNVWVAGHTWWAGADWFMLFSLTLSGRSTVIFMANWSADSVKPVTSLIITTVLVVLADASDTCNQWVSLGTGWACTVGTMILCVTLCIMAALNRSITARIKAGLFRACLIIGAVIVRFAFGCRRVWR